MIKFAAALFEVAAAWMRGPSASPEVANRLSKWLSLLDQREADNEQATKTWLGYQRLPPSLFGDVEKDPEFATQCIVRTLSGVLTLLFDELKNVEARAAVARAHRTAEGVTVEVAWISPENPVATWFLRGNAVSSPLSLRQLVEYSAGAFCGLAQAQADALGGVLLAGLRSGALRIPKFEPLPDRDIARWVYVPPGVSQEQRAQLFAAAIPAPVMATV